MPRVGSEYRDGHRDRAQWALRQAFLRKVEELTPEVLQGLLDTVLPAYRAASQEGVLPAPKWDRQRWEGVDATAHPHTAQLRTALLAWGARYHLTDDWLLDVALNTAWQQHEWREETAERRKERDQWEQAGTELPREALAALDPPPQPTSFAAVPFSDIEPVTPFAFEHEQWVPQWRTWHEYEAGLRNAFEDAVLRYRRAREAEAARRGLRQSPEKRDIDRHLAWLVQFQVDGQTYNEIASGLGGANLRTVQRAVRDMARLTGLTLRKKRLPKRRSFR